MLFIEADPDWTRADAWVAVRRYAEVCRRRPECRLWKVTAQQMDLAGKYGRKRIWAVYADRPGDEPGDGQLQEAAERAQDGLRARAAR